MGGRSAWSAIPRLALLEIARPVPPVGIALKLGQPEPLEVGVLHQRKLRLFGDAVRRAGSGAGLGRLGGGLERLGDVAMQRFRRRRRDAALERGPPAGGAGGSSTSSSSSSASSFSSSARSSPSSDDEARRRRRRRRLVVPQSRSPPDSTTVPPLLALGFGLAVSFFGLTAGLSRDRPRAPLRRPRPASAPLLVARRVRGRRLPAWRRARPAPWTARRARPRSAAPAPRRRTCRAAGCSASPRRRRRSPGTRGGRALRLEHGPLLRAGARNTCPSVRRAGSRLLLLGPAVGGHARLERPLVELGGAAAPAGCQLPRFFGGSGASASSSSSFGAAVFAGGACGKPMSTPIDAMLRPESVQARRDAGRPPSSSAWRRAWPRPAPCASSTARTPCLDPKAFRTWFFGSAPGLAMARAPEEIHFLGRGASARLMRNVPFFALISLGPASRRAPSSKPRSRSSGWSLARGGAEVVTLLAADAVDLCRRPGPRCCRQQRRLLLLRARASPTLRRRGRGPRRGRLLPGLARPSALVRDCVSTRALRCRALRCYATLSRVVLSRVALSRVGGGDLKAGDLVDPSAGNPRQRCASSLRRSRVPAVAAGCR